MSRSLRVALRAEMIRITPCQEISGVTCLLGKWSGSDPGFREFSKGGKQEWGGRRVSYRQAGRSSLPTPDPFSSDPWATLAGISAETTISDFRNCEKVNMWGEEVSVTSGLAHSDPVPIPGSS